MALKIRLRQQGRSNRLFYRLVVAEDRVRRDGKYREAIGWYNPVGKTAENNVFVKADRVQYWLDCGAILSEKAEALVARAAPEVIVKLKEKKLTRRAKMAQKRRERAKKGSRRSKESSFKCV